jgi:hypothetical protein
MGIDRIGKGAPPAVPETQGAGETGSVGETFSVEAGAKTTEAAPTESVRGRALARLQAGEIGVDGYVSEKAEEATADLAGLSPAELDDIKKLLRDQMATDPGLRDLVQAATGQTPKIPNDDEP